MNGQPRRSARDGKGINTKNAVDAAVAKPRPAKSKTHKGATHDADEEDDAIIRCVCGSEDDEGGRMMICCDNCEAWQHNDCMGVTQDPKKLPESYLCERCDPASHEDLLLAIKRGEKPWEHQSATAEDGKSRSRKGRRSKGVRSSTLRESPSQTEEHNVSDDASSRNQPEEGAPDKSKRKLSSLDRDPEQQPAKLRKGSRAARTPPSSTSTPDAVTANTSTADLVRGKVGPKHVADRVDHPTSIAELTNVNRKGVANFIKGKFEAQVKHLTSTGRFRIPRGQSSTGLAESFALAVEREMFNHHCDASKPDFQGPYKVQMSEITSNVSRNDELMLRLLSKSISPRDLAVMSSDEMASEELQREMASMKEEADKQATLVHESVRPTMRRTHKGDEFIEDSVGQEASEFSVSTAPVVRHRDSDYSKMRSSTSGGEAVDESAATANVRGSADVVNDPDRKRSSDFDIQDVWHHVPSPEHETGHVSEESPARLNHKTQDHDIDRLLDDEDNESAPYSPGSFAADSSVPWKGKLDMPNVGAFNAVAQHVAGSDLSSRLDMSAIFPQSLMLSGRIQSAKADEYLSSLGAARATDVVVHNVRPFETADREEANAQFERLFKYFMDRDRWGVVSDISHRDNVTDTYIVPLEAGDGPMPQFLSRLDYNTIESPRQRRLLLAVFVLKWRVQTAAHPSGGASKSKDLQERDSLAGSANGTAAHQGIALPLAVSRPDGNNSSWLSLFGETSPAPIERGSEVFDGARAAQIILGEFWHCSTAQQITQSHEMTPQLLQQLRRVLETNPQARTEMQELERVVGQEP